jgi:pyruvate,water dikinase
VVRGPVRVVGDPRGATLRPGEILVAERTDPGWIMLLPAAAGVIVERGSVLSHSAIVGRELGIPTVVGLRDATRWLADGDWVALDGGAGTVARVAAPVATNAPAAEVAGHA